VLYTDGHARNSNGSPSRLYASRATSYLHSDTKNRKNSSRPKRDVTMARSESHLTIRCDSNVLTNSALGKNCLDVCDGGFRIWKQNICSFHSNSKSVIMIPELCLDLSSSTTRSASLPSHPECQSRPRDVEHCWEDPKDWFGSEIFRLFTPPHDQSVC
jgi:hypothetical protein